MERESSIADLQHQSWGGARAQDCRSCSLALIIGFFSKKRSRSNKKNANRKSIQARDGVRLEMGHSVHARTMGMRWPA